MLSHLIRSKGPLNLARRGQAILSHVGITPGRMGRSLTAFAALLARHGACATFPVTATTLQRHPQLLQRLAAGPARVELAVHGYRHTDMSLLLPAQQAAELARAAALFRAAGLPCSGFRAPYLRWNEDLLAALAGARYQYDSSQSILWPVIDRDALESPIQEDLQRLLDFCHPHSAETHPALPFWICSELADRGTAPEVREPALSQSEDPSLRAKGTDLLEIPVSFPDDEILIDRLKITEPSRLAAIWGAALEQSHARGELFVLQLHPERFPLFADALAMVLDRAAQLRPPVWIATLAEIATWWTEKETSSLARFGRWPNGAGSALAISGDIDALTVWDYAGRFLGA